MSTENSFDSIINQLKTLHNPNKIEVMKCFGISINNNAFGVPVSILRTIAKPHKNNQELAIILKRKRNANYTI